MRKFKLTGLELHTTWTRSLFKKSFLRNLKEKCQELSQTLDQNYWNYLWICMLVGSSRYESIMNKQH
jgi:hypothetical protein